MYLVAATEASPMCYNSRQMCLDALTTMTEYTDSKLPCTSGTFARHLQQLPTITETACLQTNGSHAAAQSQG